MTEYYEEKKGDIEMNTKTLDQVKDEYYGKAGTPERDRLERELEALRIGFQNMQRSGKEEDDTGKTCQPALKASNPSEI